MRCRHCESTLVQKVLDLGSAPPSNAYLNAKNLRGPETGYPLVIRVCHSCWLVQTEDYAAAALRARRWRFRDHGLGPIGQRPGPHRRGCAGRMQHLTRPALPATRHAVRPSPAQPLARGPPL